jgi:hypothetical protein
LHGHAHQLTAISGQAPEFPPEAERAGVPEPPAGLAWTEIPWVVGGYTKKAAYIDWDGFVITTGLTGVDAQWNLELPANGNTPGFAPYEPDRSAPLPYGYDCFKCHTTGPQPQDPDRPEFQENRPGFQGTWAEAGIQCESCHGPGSHHFSTVDAQPVIDTTAIFVDSTDSETCGQCHNGRDGNSAQVLRAAGGYIDSEQQVGELRASGGHAMFRCTYCHDPHRSVAYDRSAAIRNACTSCHADQDMALHAGFTYTRGTYVEKLSCESCHMPFATRNGSSATAEVVGPDGRMGDTRTHIFRIDVDEHDLTFEAMFDENGAAVRKDAQNRAAVTVDFVCIRCHNGAGNAFKLMLSSANEIAFGGMHGVQQP